MQISLEEIKAEGLRYKSHNFHQDIVSSGDSDDYSSYH